MSKLFDNKQAMIDWVKVSSPTDVYEWHLKHTPWLGKKVIEDLMNVYVKDMIKLEKGELPIERMMELSEFQRKMMDSEVCK